MSTTLAFRTLPASGVQVLPGQSTQLGVVDVSPYNCIRIVADERVASGTPVNIRLVISEGPGGIEPIAQLDAFTLTPCAQVTRVYEVPGTQLTLYADAMPGGGNDAVDVLVYGSA